MGQTKLLDALREDLAKGDVLLVVGTGVSIQATGGQACAKWDGLILDGIEHCVGTNLLTERDAAALRKQLKTKNVDKRLTVAEKVSETLGAPEGGEFRRWLRESVGKLELKDRAIIDAIHVLGAPIATTNYDDLLTRSRGIAHVPWTEGASAHEIIRGDRDGVLHFHGCADHPESVVLGIRSYQKLLDSRGAQAIQQAIVANRTLLFIGCGDGLSDPNFGALLEWSAGAFGGSIYRHYCLCRSSEQKTLQKRRPPSERLFYIEYGDNFRELVPFLRRELGVIKKSGKPPAQLPSPGYCFGRERQVAEVVSALLAEDPQPVPILGGPGMGKTTIALKALHDKRVATRFHARRWFVRCDAVKSRTELAAAIARALDVPITPSVEQTVLVALTMAPGALVLDNAETLLDADGAQVEEFLSILAMIESLALVVTIRGHRRPRSVPWRFGAEAERLSDSAARETFVAAAGKNHFASDPYLPRLLGVLDGVALAITLMARFAEVFESLEPVWSRWNARRTAMLKDGEEQDRLKNVAVSYELSIGVLSAGAHRLLSVLAMLPDGVAGLDLEGVFDESEDAADELRRRALVFDEVGRLRMLAPLREYVVAAHPPGSADERRTIDHYLKLAANEGAKVGAGGELEAASRLASEGANIEAMLLRTLGDVPLEQLADHAFSAGVITDAAHSLEGLGDSALSRSDLNTARSLYEQALLFYQKMGDVFGEANCITSLGDIALARSDHDTARDRYERALLLHRRIGYLHGEASCIEDLGQLALKQSDHDAAQRQYEQALPLYQKVGSVLGEANSIKRLGDIALQRSDYEKARDRYEQALPLYQNVGDLLGEANSIMSLGDIFYKAGNRYEAESQYRKALALYERIPEPYSIGLTHRRLARLAEDDVSRAVHVAAARAAWRSIKRDDLVAELDAEFGTADS